MPESKPFTYIDLFAGCGGLSLGLHNAGWKGLFAIEKSPHAFKTLQHNLINKKQHFDWPSWLPQCDHEIGEVLANYQSNLLELRDKVDLVVGGPPCQGFSTAGLRQEGDVRNGMIRQYLRFIMAVRPTMIFFENVKGFTLKFEKNKSKGIAYSQYVLRVLKWFGYDVKGEMLDFSKFGIPQKRARFILVGIKREVAKKEKVTAATFFERLTKNKKKFLKKRDLTEKPTLSAAISDLLQKNGLVETPDRKPFNSGLYSTARTKYQKYLRKGVTAEFPNSHSFANHTSEVKKRLKFFLTKKNDNKNIKGNIKKKLKINKHTIIPLSGHLVAPTITTLPDDYVHYKEPRILTVREYARIQSFPDWYEIQGKYTTGGKLRTQEVPRYTQIGNAIPPLFGEQCGVILKELIK